MGLIKALTGATGGILADQWKEFFRCEAIPADVLVMKGQKVAGKRSSNTKGTDNIITTGSVILVADGQCMMIVDQGQIVEFAAEPGEYTYDASTEPTIFCGDLGEGLKQSFAQLGKRFTFGGEPPKDQRIYYFNTKELMGNKYGTPSPVPFRVVDNNIGLDIEISIRCFGEFSYRICDPMLFYKNVCGNVTENYTRDNLDGQMKTELLTALGPAFAKISAKGIRYSALPGHTFEIAEALNEVLSSKWRNLRGLEIVSFGVSNVNASEEDEAMIKELQKTAVFRNANMAGAYMVGAQGEAMKTAAANPNGAMMGFMGMGMAQQAGGMNAAQLFQIGQQQTAQQQAQQLIDAQAQAMANAAAAPAGGWKCSCGATATGKFCPECGAKKPEPKPVNGWKCSCGAMATGKFCPECGSPKPADNSWKCSCGATVTGKFCPECGSKKPSDDGSWTCSCGQKNTGKFCPNCGSKKPAGIPQYKCDKCGWQPADPTKAPRFCPECGDPFDNGDII